MSGRFRPGYEAARRRVSFEEAPLDCAEEKRKRVCARGERRMQRMEHCHDWAEKEQCDRSRESRVRTSELRRSRIENKNADLKRLFCGRHFCLPIDGHKHVGAILPANPLPFVESRQHAPDFPGRPTSMLAPTSRQSLCLPPGHANKLRLILVALTIDILAGTSEE